MNRHAVVLLLGVLGSVLAACNSDAAPAAPPACAPVACEPVACEPAGPAGAAEGAAENAGSDAGIATPEAAAWSYDESTDPMTGRVGRFARMDSVNTIDLESPYSGTQHATLMIRNHPSNGQDVMLLIRRGQLLCHSYQDCQITVRFDDGEPQSWRATGPADGSSTTMFLRRYDDFVRQLRAASVVRIRAEIYQAGSPVFEFAVAGYDDSRVNPAGSRLRRGSGASVPDHIVKPPCAAGYTRRGDSVNCTLDE